MKRVCILDYGSGNVKSVFNLVRSITDHVEVSNDSNQIANASHLILPGVGAFGAAMKKIHQNLPIKILEAEIFKKGKPFLGICVGMQVLADKGYEFGEHAGLGWIKGSVRQLPTNGLVLPHIGWNSVSPHSETPLLRGLEGDPDCYFVHSFALQDGDDSVVKGITEYGTRFPSVVQQDNVFGVQFHPEKSHRYGMQVLKNFANL